MRLTCSAGLPSFRISAVPQDRRQTWIFIKLTKILLCKWFIFTVILNTLFRTKISLLIQFNLIIFVCTTIRLPFVYVQDRYLTILFSNANEQCWAPTLSIITLRLQLIIEFYRYLDGLIMKIDSLKKDRLMKILLNGLDVVYCGY